MAENSGNNINLELKGLGDTAMEGVFEINLSEEHCLHSVLELIHDIDFDSVQTIEDFVPKIMSMFEEKGIDGEVILHRVH